MGTSGPLSSRCVCVCSTSRPAQSRAHRFPPVQADIAGTGKILDGIDLVTLDSEGKMTDFAVLARPPNAVEELKKQMMMRVPVKMAALKAKKALGFA